MRCALLMATAVAIGVGGFAADSQAAGRDRKERAAAAQESDERRANRGRRADRQRATTGRNRQTATAPASSRNSNRARNANSSRRAAASPRRAVTENRRYRRRAPVAVNRWALGGRRSYDRGLGGYRSHGRVYRDDFAPRRHFRRSCIAERRIIRRIENRGWNVINVTRKPGVVIAKAYSDNGVKYWVNADNCTGEIVNVVRIKRARGAKRVLRKFRSIF